MAVPITVARDTIEGLDTFFHFYSNASYSGQVLLRGSMHQLGLRCGCSKSSPNAPCPFPFFPDPIACHVHQIRW